MYRNQGFRQFASIFVDFLRFSSIFVDFPRKPWFLYMALGGHVQESRFSPFSSILFEFRRFSSIFDENLDSCTWPPRPMYRNQGFRRFSSVFFGFRRFSSGFVDFHRKPWILYMALGSHVQESRFSSILVGFLRFSSIFFGFRRFSSKTLNPVYGPWGPCTGIKVFVDFRWFSSVFFGFLRVSSIFVLHFLRFSSMFFDFRRFLGWIWKGSGWIWGLDLRWIWMVLESGSDPVICPICPICPVQIGILELNQPRVDLRESWPDPPADTFWTLFLTSTRTLLLDRC